MTRVFFHVQNLLGMGHLRRAAELARALTAAGLEVDFVSGGFPVPGVDLGAARLVQLPPARAADESFATILDEAGRPISEDWRRRRREAVLAAFAARPADALLVELYPFGRRAFRFELEPLLAAAASRLNPPAVLCSVRDILVDKGRPDRNAETLAVLRRHFHAVLVHGDPAVAPFSVSFPRAAEIADLLRYTGYVVRAEAPPVGESSGEVVVSAGGGAVGQPLVEAALGARPLCRAGDLPWRVVLGPNYPEEGAQAVLAKAPAGVAIERFRPDLPALYARAALSVSQAGYNTVMELVAAGARAVVVPFARGGESEQGLRARLLAERGLLHVVEENGLTPDRLAAALDRALATPRPKPGGGLNLDGAVQTARMIVEEVARRRGSRHDGGPERLARAANNAES